MFLTDCRCKENITLDWLSLRAEAVLAMDKKFSSDWELVQDEAQASTHRLCECSQCESIVRLHPAPPQTWPSMTTRFVTQVLRKLQNCSLLSYSASVRGQIKIILTRQCRLMSCISSLRAQRWPMNHTGTNKNQNLYRMRVHSLNHGALTAK